VFWAHRADLPNLHVIALLVPWLSRSSAHNLTRLDWVAVTDLDTSDQLRGAEDVPSRRASIEEAIRRHDARQWWVRPLLVLAVLAVLGAVIAGTAWVVDYETAQTSPPAGDPGGGILQMTVRTLDQSVPPGARIVSHRYTEPRRIACPRGYVIGQNYTDVLANVVFIAPATESAQSIDRYLSQHHWAGTGLNTREYDFNYAIVNGGMDDAQIGLSFHRVALGRGASTWEFNANAPSFSSCEPS
jgi:hypothetical protein